MSQKSSAPPTRGLDLSRFCAVPLITYCEAKETSHEQWQDG